MSSSGIFRQNRKLYFFFSFSKMKRFDRRRRQKIIKNQDERRNDRFSQKKNILRPETKEIKRTPGK